MNRQPLREGCAQTLRSSSTSSKSKPFIVDADARLFKGKNKLSLGEQSLYMTMRSLADGQTGELAINGHALDWRFICREAQIGRCTWLKRRRGLIAAGLLYERRDRVTYYDHKARRSRTGLGETHYFIRRQPETPKSIEKPTILLGSTSCTVEEVDPQIIQNHPEPYPRGVGGVACLLEPERAESSSSPCPAPKTHDDDDDAVRVSSVEPEVKPDNLTRLREKAEKMISQNYPTADPELTGIILDKIMDRVLVQGLGLSIGSPNYFFQAFENFLNSREFLEAEDEHKHRVWLREKHMPGFDPAQFSDQPDEKLTERVRQAVRARGVA